MVGIMAPSAGFNAWKWFGCLLAAPNHILADLLSHPVSAVLIKNRCPAFQGDSSVFKVTRFGRHERFPMIAGYYRQIFGAVERTYERTNKAFLVQ